jgi:RNA polymerase sigma factor (sigma-70 family)
MRQRAPSIQSAAPATFPALDGVFESERRFLWGLLYRMTGCAADADDLVQETFVRVMERPPERSEGALRQWLVRVALNLGRDLLRRRRRRGYVGPWLPSPIETPEEEPPAYEVADSHITTEGRYELMESVSFAFLLALEALTPMQRATLLLRDVFDYSVHETAQALGVSEPNVKTTHHRARRAMRDYEKRRCVPTESLRDRTCEALEKFLGALVSQDVALIESLLARDVRSMHDSGGEFVAARRTVHGRDKVQRFYLGLAKHTTAMPPRIDLRMLNGLPALVLDFPATPPRVARRFVMRVDVDASGKVSAVHTVLASRKLTGLKVTGERASG